MDAVIGDVEVIVLGVVVRGADALTVLEAERLSSSSRRGNVPCRHRLNPPFSRRPVLVEADARTVDYDDLAVIGGGHGLQDTVPNARLPPANEAVVAGGVRTVALGNVPPGRACAKAPKNTVQNPPIIDARDAARLVRQQGLDDRPLPVAQLVSTHARPPSYPGGESYSQRHGNPVYGFTA